MARHRSVEDQLSELTSAGVSHGSKASKPKRPRAATSKRTETLADLTASPPKKSPRKRPGREHNKELTQRLAEERATVAQERATTLSPPGEDDSDAHAVKDVPENPSAVAAAPPAAAAAATVPGPLSANLQRGPDDLNNLLKGDTSRLTAVGFGADYSIKDEDVFRLVDAAGENLTVLTLGSSDTGAGVHLTDAAVKRIAAKCPKLTVLALNSCTGVTDSAFTAVCRSLGQLRELSCTGHDRRNGRLTKKALEPLLKEGCLPQLQRLYLTDQGVSFDAVQRLMKQRKGVQVQAGESDSDSMAWGMVMKQSGRNYGDGLYGNMRY